MIEQQEQMQQIIEQTIQSGDLFSAYEALNIYRKTFVEDGFVTGHKYLLYDYGPKVSVICLSCSDTETEEFINSQKYHNLEIVRVSQDDNYTDIIEYMCNTDSRYVSFLESHQICDENKIADMVWKLEITERISTLISVRNIIDTDGTIIEHPDYAYEETFKNTLVKGRVLLEHCISNNVNIYGILSCVLVSTRYIKEIGWKSPSYSNDLINRLSVLYQLMLNGTVSYIDTPLVSTVVEEYADDSDIRKEYQQLLADLVPEFAPLYKYDSRDRHVECKKDITFFYTDKGEYYNLEPIAEEARKRGYTVRYSEDVKEKAEIGVYCQHVYYPENSRFSLVLLHDMEQGHNRWPNLWEAERWGRFDIGIVPGKAWADRWEQCACIKYVNPRCGTYEFGYPKSDIVNDSKVRERTRQLREQLNLKYDVSVLYAPSWEYADKEDDFIKAVAPLKVNMLIKQAHWSKEYQAIIDNIDKMRAQHEGKYDNLYYIDVTESIMTALDMCDIIVSDESSVMSEGLMFDKPSIAVTDWLIPDTDPVRFSCVPMDYVVKCKKADLRDTVEKLINNADDYREIMERGRQTFSNAGNVCTDIMDAVDYYTQDKPEAGFVKKKLESRYRIFDMWN